jgi:hypothetical protein
MKANRYLVILVAVIVLLPFAGRLFWLLKEGKKLDILIINKSVKKSSTNEIRALNWTLNAEKFVDSAGDNYKYSNDYLGYFPDAVVNERKIRSFALEDVSSIIKSFDVLFFADNGGVELESPQNKSSGKMHYGGFNQNDYYLLKEMLGRQKLVIAEYNFVSDPTEDLVRYNTEQFIDIYTLDWTGKYFKNLSKNQLIKSLPLKWFELYQNNNNNKEWDFTGPGIILFNNRENRIIILPADQYMNSKYPDVVTSADVSKEFRIPERASFNGWFSLVYQGRNRIISNFNLNLNEAGAQILRNNGISPEFPAVIESTNKKFYYFSGDFSKVPVFMASSRIGFLTSIVRPSRTNSNNPDKFFKMYYDPLLSTVLNSYYTEISGIEK